MLAATLDDLVAEPERPNMPGADGRRPNWSIALSVSLESLEVAPAVGEVANLLAASVKEHSMPSRAPGDELPSTRTEN